MAKNTPAVPPNLMAAVSPATIQDLAKIKQVTVSWSPDDTTSMIDQGCVLLGIARVDNDEHYGFRFLIGLPEGVTVTENLALRFHK